MERLYEYTSDELILAAQALKSILKDEKNSGIRINFDKEENKIGLIKKLEDYSRAIVNNGLDLKNGGEVTLEGINDSIQKIAAKDQGTNWNTNILSRVVVTRAIQNVKEPDSIFANFSETLNKEPHETIVQPIFGAAGGARDVGEMEEYPIISIDATAEKISSTGKSGIAVEISRETQRKSTLNLLALFLKAAKVALARHKDNKAFMTLENAGTVGLDSIEPGIYGKPTGRSKSGAENGTISITDIYKIIIKKTAEGINLDTLLLSPSAYLSFILDPKLKNFIEKNGGVVFATPNGTIGANRSLTRSLLATRGTGESNRVDTDINRGGMTNMPLKIIVTPYVNSYTEGDPLIKGRNKGTVSFYKDVNGNKIKCQDEMATDMILIDSSRALYYVKESDIMSETIQRSIIQTTRFQFSEYYDFLVKEQGRGVVNIKNINVTEDVEDWASKIKLSFTEAKDMGIV